MFDPRVAVASLSGESDAEWATAAAPHVGCAFLGGIALDERTRGAARELVARDRTEFLPDSPVRFIDRQLAALADVDLQPAFNVRAVDSQAIREVAAVCADHGAICEINAHCRQAEMCAVGAGESLLREEDRLRAQIAAAAATGATVSVKLRTEVDGVELPALAPTLVAAGASVLHVDAMDSEPMIERIHDTAPDAFLVANNGVRDRATAREYLEFGADAVSIGRPSDDLAVLERVRSAVAAWFEDGESTPETDQGVYSDA
jgi:TIM-barrel protein